jgi:hypothetical protein
MLAGILLVPGESATVPAIDRRSYRAAFGHFVSLLVLSGAHVIRNLALITSALHSG